MSASEAGDDLEARFAEDAPQGGSPGGGQGVRSGDSGRAIPADKADGKAAALARATRLLFEDPITSETLLSIADPLKFPCRSFPVRKIDADAEVEIRDALALIPADRRILSEILGLPAEARRDEDIFFKLFLDRVERAPWMFDPAMIKHKAHLPAKKRGKRNLSRRILDHQFNLYSISSEADDEENALAVFSTIGRSPASCFLIYLTMIRTLFDDWLTATVEAEGGKFTRSELSVAVLTIDAPSSCDPLIGTDDRDSSDPDTAEDPGNADHSVTTSGDIIAEIETLLARVKDTGDVAAVRRISECADDLEEILIAEEARARESAASTARRKDIRDRAGAFGEDGAALCAALDTVTDATDDQLDLLERALEAAQAAGALHIELAQAYDAARARVASAMADDEFDIVGIVSKELSDLKARRAAQPTPKALLEDAMSCLQGSDSVGAVETALSDVGAPGTGPMEDAADQAPPPSDDTDESAPGAPTILDDPHPEEDETDEKEPQGASPQEAGAAPEVPEARRAGVADPVGEPDTDTPPIPESAARPHFPDTETQPEGQPEKSREPGPGTARVPRSAEIDLDTSFGALLDAGYPGAAARLSAAAMRKGWDVSLGAATLTVVAASRMSFDAYGQDTTTFNGLVSDAQAEIFVRDDENDLSGALLLGALLKLAILRNEIGLRDIIPQIALRHGDAVSYLQRLIGELGYDFLPTRADIESIDGRTPRDLSPERLKEVLEWRESCKNKHTSHLPSRVMIKKLVSFGSLGDFLDLLETDPVAAADIAQGIVSQYITPQDVEARIREFEKDDDVPAKSRIQHRTLDWIQRNIIEGAYLISAWQETYLAGRKEQEVSKANTLKAQIGELIKASDAAARSVTATGTEPLQCAVSVWLARQLSDFTEFLRGNEDPTPMGLTRALTFDLDLLPSGFDAPGHDAIDVLKPDTPLDEDLRRTDEAVLRSIGSGPIPGPVAAFRSHLEEGALNTALRVLGALEAGILVPEQPCDLEVMRDDLTETHDEVNKRFLRVTRDLLRRLKDDSVLDLHYGDKTRQMLESLEEVELLLTEGPLSLPPQGQGRLPPAASPLPQQHSQLKAIFDQAEGLSENIRNRIQQDQEARLDAILEQRPEAADDVARLKEEINTAKLQTIDDQIAQLAEGQPLTLDSEEPNHPFDAFFPDFVGAAQNPEDTTWPTSEKDYRAAFSGQAGWAPELALPDGSDREAAGLMMAAWFNMIRCHGQPKASKPAAEKFLGQLGITNFNVKPFQGVRGVDMCGAEVQLEIAASGWFLPPVFGSRSGGKYKLFTCSSRVVLDQIETALTDRDQAHPKIVLMAGRLSVEKRRQLAQRFRSSRIPALVIDETLMAFMAIRAERRLHTLFDCATPFGYIQPYTTDAGPLPREMFFGREQEIEKICGDSNDGILVYGGRQLGKSALLHHVEGLYHAPQEGRIVMRRDVLWLGRPSDPAETIWGRISEGLEPYGVTSATMVSSTEVVDTIRFWLNVAAGRRILILLDETDNFMSSEARNGFVNLTALKKLMEDTQRRFKIVFAGLHNVRRMLEAPNSPLQHLGPICVGPLTSTIEDKRSARALVTEPLHAAGYRFENPDDVSNILAYVSHYPSLIQIVMKELASAPRVTGPGPLFLIKSRGLFEGQRFGSIQDAVRERFQMTLRLDPRFQLIAAVMARMRHENDDVSVIQKGLRVDHIRAEVSAYWPKTLQAVTNAGFKHILEEMEELGVLSRSDDGGRELYRLRTSQILTMIGSLEQIDETLLSLSDYEANVDYDSGTYRRRVLLPGDKPDLPAIEQRRIPLSDDQVTEVFSHHPGVRCIAGLPAFGLKDIPKLLEALCGPTKSWNERENLEFEVVPPRQKDLRKALDRKRRGNEVRVLFIQPDASAAVDFASHCDTRGEVIVGDIIPVFLLDASDPALLAFACRRKALALRPWGHQMLRAHFEEVDANGLDQRGLRESMLVRTGGLPGPLMEFTRKLRPSAGSLDEDSIKSIEPGFSLPRFDVDLDLLSEIEDCTEPDVYETMCDIVREHHSRDPMDAFSMFDILGLIEQHDPSRGVLRLSRLAHLLLASRD